MLQRPVQVVLFTNRPSVSAFFEAHSARIGADVSFALMPLDDSSVDASAQRVQHADSVIVDIGSHPDTGVRLCAGLRSRWPELRVLAIVCCWQPTLAWHIQQLIASRVDEVLDAQASPADIFAAAQGDHEARLRVQLRGPYDLMQSTVPALGAHDRRLLELVARGWSDEELSGEFGVSGRTVRGRLERLRELLGVRNREELAAWAGAHGLYAPTVRVSAAKIGATPTLSYSSSVNAYLPDPEVKIAGFDIPQ